MEKTAAGTIRVVVIDNAVIERGHIVSLINAAEKLQVVGIGEDGMDAIHLSQTLNPDIILMSVMTRSKGSPRIASSASPPLAAQRTS